MRDERAFLKDILDSCEMIRRLVKGSSYEEFIADEAIQEAVQRRLGVIGEAARQISDTTRQRLPQIPWDQIIRMRHVLVHIYFSVKLPIVWETAIRDVPVLAEAIRTLLPEQNDPESE